MGRPRKKDALVARLPKWSAREWDAWRRGIESGQAIGRQDGMELAEELPRRAGPLLRLPEVIKLTGLSRATIHRRERAGRFPNRVQTSDNAVGWYEREVRAWLDSRPRAR